MSIASCVGTEPTSEPIVGSAAELDRLGDEIAELAAHLDAATARLLDLIREFDARGGWNTGFLSCAGWLTWRVGLDPGAARERVRVARALGTLPRLRRHWRTESCRTPRSAPLPGLRSAVRPGASHPPLGPRRADHALEPGAPLSPPPPRGARRGLSGGATARRRAKIPAPGRTVTPRRPVSAQRGARSRPRPASAARIAGALDPRTHGDAGLAGGTPGRGLGDRRLAPVGGSDPE